jgi:hypothetical protein
MAFIKDEQYFCDALYKKLFAHTLLFTVTLLK